ncbi:MAG: hypothetical protein GY798_13800 [Hyphomicrobiales bacterium]|nr:hypothetical protein [Hyphomicrobiales bacterium]
MRLWDTESGTQIGPPLAEGIGDVLSVAFSPDGTGLIAGTGAGKIHGWRLADGEALLTGITDVHTSDVWSLTFAPSGDWFATVSSGGTSALFAYPDGRFEGRAFDPEDHVQSAVFTHNGAGLVGGSDDGRVHVWDPTARTTTAVSPAGHTGKVWEIALSSDDRHLATLGRDQTVRLWTLNQPIATAEDRRVAAGGAKGVAIGADGATVAAADENGRVYLWRAGRSEPETGDVIKPFAEDAGQATRGAISPDGTKVATVTTDGHAEGQVHSLG